MLISYRPILTNLRINTAWASLFHAAKKAGGVRRRLSHSIIAAKIRPLLRLMENRSGVVFRQPACFQCVEMLAVGAAGGDHEADGGQQRE